MTRKLVLVFLTTCANVITSLLGCGNDVFLTNQNLTNHFTSPNFGANKLYPLNVFCRWNIISSNSSIILLEFSHFDIELHIDCIWDYVRIYDGTCGAAGNNEGNKYCGTSLPSNFTSVSNQMCVEFRSDVIVAKSGFNTTVHLINQTADPLPVIPEAPCSSSPYIIKVSSIIRTPNYGPQSSYPNNRICQWIVNPNNQVVEVLFESFDVEYQASCGYDSLKIFNGSSSSSIVRSIFCGNSIPQVLYINHTSLFVFTSDVVVPRPGFKAMLKFLPSTENTSSNLLLSEESSLSSTEYPPSSVISTEYLSSAVPKESTSSSQSPSVITDSTPYNIVTETKPTSVFTEFTSSSVSTDSLSTVSQSSTNPTPNSSSSALMESPSTESAEVSLSSNSVSTTLSFGSSSPTSDLINENINSITSRASTNIFTTNAVIQNTYDICSRSFLTIEGPVYIVSPNYGPSQLYPLNVDCKLSIHNKHNKVMKLSMIKVDIENHPQCSWDSLVIYDGDIMDSSKILATICSNNLFSFNSTESSTTLHFISDQIISKTGFKVLVKPKSYGLPSLMTTTSASTDSKETTITSDPKTQSQTTEWKNMPTMFSTSLHTTSTLTIPLEQMTDQPSNIPSTDNTVAKTQSKSLTPEFTTVSPIAVDLSSSLSSIAQHPSQGPTMNSESQISEFPLTLETTLTPLFQSPTTAKSTTPSQQESTIASAPSDHSTNEPLNICEHKFMNVTKAQHIVSPNFGLNRKYPLNKDCGLLLESKASSKLQLDFDFFELEYHNQCVWDYLAIYDGNSSSPLLSKLCGTRVNDTFSSSENQLFIQFRSDLVIPKRGFSIHVTVNETVPAATETIPMVSPASQTPTALSTTQAVPSSTMPPSTTVDVIAIACSGAPMILTSSYGLIASPGFYSQKEYDNNLNCMWVIQAQLNMNIQISFRSVDIEYQETCGWDKLSIYDGSSSTDNLVGNYCGTIFPENITSTGNNLLIQFKTDRLISRTGFELSFNFLESQNVTVTCTVNWVPCTNGVCIPQEWLCDGEADCEDSIDENSCEFCDEDEFRCYSGKCLPQYQNCDGIAQCSDAEDEDRCIKVSNMSRLMVMSSGTWFTACDNGMDADFALETCKSMEFPGLVSFESVQSTGSKTFAVIKDVKSLNDTSFHSNFILSTVCPSGKAVTISCGERVCGKKPDDLPQPFVVGGIRSLKGEWPWMVAILSGPNYICGGTIIADQWVITAGHCIQDIIHSPQTTSVRVGSPSLKDEEATSYRVSEMMMNPEYNFIYKADIALLRVQTPIVFTSNIRPLCLPTRRHNWSSSLPCYVSGWGVNHPQNAKLKITSDDLHHGKMKLWSQSKCEAVYPGKIKDFMICAGYEMGIIDACQGDSGGPLMCKTGDDNWKFVGVTSWGEGCGEINRPGVYTRVDHYLDWIKSTIQSTPSKASCDFEKPTICGYRDESNSALMWTRRSGVSSYHTRPKTDVSFNNISGNYMYAYIPYEGRDKAANLLSPVLNLTNDGCLTFWFHFYGGIDASLKVFGESKTNNSINQLANFWTTTSTWRSTEVDLTPGLKRFIFVVNAGKKVNGGVAIDEVKVTSSHCKGLAKLSCNFDGGSFCNYQNAVDDSGEWQIKVNVLNKVDVRSSNPGQDHYLEVDGRKQALDTRTKLLSPELNSTVSKCLSFRYRIYPAYSMTLSICTITETSGISYSNCHWIRSTSDNNSWTLASAQLPPVPGIFRIGVQADRKYLPGVVNIDEIKRRDGNC